jgi:hypothetical protein
MQLILALDDACDEILMPLRSRFAPDCPTNSWENSRFVILDDLPIKHAKRYPEIIRKIVDRQVSFPLGNVTPFEQRKVYRNGRYKPPGVALSANLTPEILKIRLKCYRL